MAYLNSVSAELSDRENGQLLAEKIFNAKELYIMRNKFSIFFNDKGELRVEIAVYTHVPEPGTCGLFSGVFIAGLALLHRRRKKLAPANLD